MRLALLGLLWAFTAAAPCLAAPPSTASPPATAKASDPVRCHGSAAARRVTCSAPFFSHDFGTLWIGQTGVSMMLPPHYRDPTKAQVWKILPTLPVPPSKDDKDSQVKL